VKCQSCPPIGSFVVEPGCSTGRMRRGRQRSRTSPRLWALDRFAEEAALADVRTQAPASEPSLAKAGNLDLEARSEAACSTA